MAKDSRGGKRNSGTPFENNLDADRYIYKAKVGDRGLIEKETGREFFIAQKWENEFGEYRDFIYVAPVVDGKVDVRRAVRQETGWQINAPRLKDQFNIKKTGANK